MSYDDMPDIDALIAGYADHLSRDSGTPEDWFSYGALLLGRADINDDPADLDDAITWLRRAADAAGADNAAQCWQGLALAHHRRWQRTHDTRDRDQTVACVDAGESAGGPDADQHRLRLDALGSEIDGRYDPPAMAIRGRIRGLLERLYAILDPNREVDADEATSAQACAVLEISTFAMAPDYIDHRRVDRWLDVARRHPAPPPGWLDGIAMIGGLCATQEQLVKGSAGLDGIQTVLAALRNPRFAQNAEPRAAGMSMSQVVGVATAAAGSRRGDIGMMTEAAALLAGATGDGGSADPVMAIVAAWTALMPAVHSGDTDTVTNLLARLTAITRTAPAMASDDPIVELARWAVPLMAIEYGHPADAVAPTNSFPADDDPWSARATSVSRLAVQVDTAVKANDASGLRAAIPDLTEFAEQADPQGVSVLATQSLAYAWLTLAGWHPWDREAVEAAVRWNTTATDRWQTPVNQVRSAAHRNLACALRLRGGPGDAGRSRELGLSALREDALQVLLQSGTDHGAVSARSAAGHAVRLAEWCVADVDTDPAAKPDLIRALEAGRGLVLHAAVTARTVTKQLAANGHADLAAEWETAGGADRLDTAGLPGAQDIRLPGDLRRRVIQALTSADHAGHLLSAPSLDEVTDALARTGTDVLAYVVPASGQRGGMAVLVTAKGAIEILRLPALTVDTAVSGYAKAYQEWANADKATRPAREAAWRQQLSAVGAWAWQVAGERILTAARALCHDGTPRLALVPFGMLSIVPWHSAWRPESSGRRYLVQDAIVSVVPSARMLHDVATRTPLANGDVLVVGNPADNLRWAWLEADGICRELYRDATCLGVARRAGLPGRPAPSGRGTPAEVLDWLDKHETTPGRLLHLACHALADPSHPGRSSVGLAGDRLAVHTLLERWPTSRLRLGTVVLSGCTTDVSAYNYDEAFSIATTFLALGARAAIGSLWNIEEVHTSVFMFMFHHHLTGRHPDAPGAALHATRLWMLDPDRRAPDTMPDILRHRIGTLELAEPAYWAAFNHVGV